ncbi:MAG: hypothetical protein J0L52_01895 [Caulobacterales bacterium]|nr:hypothetical protein [Caulobacterales bacterium]
MPRPFNKLIACLVTATAVSWAGSALAADPLAALGGGYTAGDAPLGEPTELHIDLRGEVAPRCDLVTPPVFGGRLDFNRAGAIQSAFRIDCNTPFTLRVRSRHGAFASTDPTPGVAEATPYEVGVEVGTDSGRQNLGWCASTMLSEDGSAACGFGPAATDRGWSSQDAIAIDQSGTIRVRWDAPDADAPRLGSYSDIIVIQLEVRA